MTRDEMKDLAIEAIALDEESWEAFLNMLLDPPPPSQALIDLMRGSASLPPTTDN